MGLFVHSHGSPLNLFVQELFQCPSNGEFFYLCYHAGMSEKSEKNSESFSEEQQAMIDELS